MTFGYHRVGVIIAIVNALSIFAIALFIFYEAIRRLQHPPEVDSPIMLIVATIGLSVNLLVAFWLRKEQRANLNVRSAFWHSLGDALASIGVILGGIIILTTGLFVVDPIISIAIGLIIILAAWNIFRDGLRVLLEATPPQIDLSQMISDLKNVHPPAARYELPRAH
jgi:cobalt-zinc-cadmium efflux system protein